MQVFRTLPKEIVVAVSGGSDSMFALHWLLKRGHKITIAHFMHNSDFAQTEFDFVSKVSDSLNLPMMVDAQKESRVNQSQEEYWRDGRYSFFKKFNLPVVVGHHLDDAVEWYMFSALNGKIQLLNYSHYNVVRPFILQRKSEMTKYLMDNKIQWLEDKSNADVKFARRNNIRHSLIPVALEINPGLHAMVKKMIFEKEHESK